MRKAENEMLPEKGKGRFAVVDWAHPYHAAA